MYRLAAAPSPIPSGPGRFGVGQFLEVPQGQDLPVERVEGIQGVLDPEQALGPDGGLGGGRVLAEQVGRQGGRGWPPEGPRGTATPPDRRLASGCPGGAGGPSPAARRPPVAARGRTSGPGRPGTRPTGPRPPRTPPGRCRTDRRVPRSRRSSRTSTMRRSRSRCRANSSPAATRSPAAARSISRATSGGSSAAPPAIPSYLRARAASRTEYQEFCTKSRTGGSTDRCIARLDRSGAARSSHWDRRGAEPHERAARPRPRPGRHCPGEVRSRSPGHARSAWTSRRCRAGGRAGRRPSGPPPQGPGRPGPPRPPTRARVRQKPASSP